MYLGAALKLTLVTLYKFLITYGCRELVRLAILLAVFRQFPIHSAILELLLINVSSDTSAPSDNSGGGTTDNSQSSSPDNSSSGGTSNGDNSNSIDSSDSGTNP
jgi:hypothetical protein